MGGDLHHVQLPDVELLLDADGNRIDQFSDRLAASGLPAQQRTGPIRENQLDMHRHGPG